MQEEDEKKTFNDDGGGGGDEEGGVLKLRGATLGESRTDSCDSLLEIVNYLDSESESAAITDADIIMGAVSPEKPVPSLKRSSSARSDASDHIISQFLDKSVDDVGPRLPFVSCGYFICGIRDSGNANWFVYRRTPFNEPLSCCKCTRRF